MCQVLTPLHLSTFLQPQDKLEAGTEIPYLQMKGLRHRQDHTAGECLNLGDLILERVLFNVFCNGWENLNSLLQNPIRPSLKVEGVHMRDSGIPTLNALPIDHSLVTLRSLSKDSSLPRADRIKCAPMHQICLWVIIHSFSARWELPVVWASGPWGLMSIPQSLMYLIFFFFCRNRDILE